MPNLQGALELADGDVLAEVRVDEVAKGPGAEAQAVWPRDEEPRDQLLQIRRGRWQLEPLRGEPRQRRAGQHLVHYLWRCRHAQQQYDRQRCAVHTAAAQSARMEGHAT